MNADVDVCVIYFGSSESDDYQKVHGEFETVAKDFRGKVKTTFSFPNRNDYFFYLGTFYYC
jgi:hypothetical protein